MQVGILMNNPSLLDVENLVVSVHDKPIVKGISFSIQPGQRLAVVGESGSGKTTTALAVLRLLSKKSGFEASGRVVFDSQDLLTLSDGELRQIRGRKASMIFQDPTASLNPILSIGEQIGEMFEIHEELTDEEVEAKTVEALESVGLGNLHNPWEVYPHELSGGMKQRVMIAMSLCLNPKLLIADEPTSALDLTVQKDILALLKQYQGAMLLITHDFGVVKEMADNVCVLYRGNIVEQGKTDAVLQNPQHAYTKSLLAALPTKANRRKLLPVGVS